jgi:SOS-response transcriptional repressor LexA
MEESMTTRPTKKQYELLSYLRKFISEHGYSPSYREIMRGCNYTSVATVALHVNNLIARGHVVKRNKSARSLEVVGKTDKEVDAKSNYKHELIDEIEKRFKLLEKEESKEIFNEIYVLVGALKILGHKDASRAYVTRINEINKLN